MSQLQDTQKALDNVRRELQLINAEFMAAGNDLGEALAKVRTGDKKAQGAANKASMRRAELSTERDKLQLQENALVGMLQQLEAAEAERLREEALPAFEEIDGEVRELQHQYTEMIRTAAEIGQKLKALQEPWTRAARDARRAGHAVDADHWKYPTDLMKPRVLSQPEVAIKQWLGPSVWRQYAEIVKRPKSLHFKQGVTAWGEHVMESIRIERDENGFLIAPAGFGLPDTNVSYLKDGDVA